MKKGLLILGTLCISILGNAQHYLDIQAGYSGVNPTQWNRTISAYSFARPWLTDVQPNIKTALNTSLAYSGVIAKGIFLTPSLSHQVFKSLAETVPSKTEIKIRWMSANLNIDIYPREFGLDSVGHTFRPFVRLGGGASSLLPRVRFNDSLSMVDDENYKPVIWSYQFNFGIGSRFAINNFLDISPIISAAYYPNINLEDFRYALHGTASPNLSDVQKLVNLQFMIAISIRLGLPKEEKD
jgi:hypothetical protein